MPAGDIRIRSYNVGFGDCFLVTFPDGAVMRNMVIDFGNAPGQLNTDYPEIARNIHDETGGHLDVVVMTHEHLDHIEGFYAERKIFDACTVDWVWMSLPSHPDYYTRYPKAETLKKIRALAARFEKRLAARGIAVAPSFLMLLRNNLTNADRIDYIRNLSGTTSRVLYLRRGNSVLNKPFSKRVKIRILAPEPDVSVYYGGSGAHGLRALTRRLLAAVDDADTAAEDNRWRFPGVSREPGAPRNLSDRDWRLLRASIQSGAVESIRAIDKAANNTSLVFTMEIGGRRLIFPGDAELESWAIMREKQKSNLKPFDFLKVAHHGSHNGTPLDLLDTILPVARKDKVSIMVSTKSKVYGTINPVPDENLMTTLRARCKKLISTDGSDQLWVDATV